MMTGYRKIVGMREENERTTNDKETSAKNTDFVTYTSLCKPQGQMSHTVLRFLGAT